MALIAGIERNNTYWIVIMIPLTLISGLSIFLVPKAITTAAVHMKENCKHMPAEIKSMCTWEPYIRISNETGIATQYLPVPASAIHGMNITGPRTDATYTGETLCSLKKKITHCLITEKCTVANLTSFELKNLYAYVNAIVYCN